MVQVHISCLFICFLKLTLHLLIDFAESDASEHQEDEVPAQREEHSQRAYTWFFRAQVYGNLVDSSQYSTIKALLDSRKGRQEECLAVAETITYTCSEFLGTEPRTISVKGFVHGNGRIGECSLKQWMPMNHIPELKAIEFEAVNPGRNQRDRRYRNHPAIKTFLDATSLEPTVDGRPLRVDYYGSSEANERANLERAHPWFWHARVRFLGNRNFSNVLADRKERQEACLQAASLISFACSAVLGTESEYPGTVQVQILLHGKAGKPV